MIKLFGSNKSFFDIERKKVEKIIKTPLLELVLEYLPHLQLSEKEQEDYWEIIAIKLNDLQFNDKILKSKWREENDIDELPMLSGPFIKELFHKIMSEFEHSVQSFNLNQKIYRANFIRGPEQQSTMYFAFNLPVKEAYSERDDLLCCELFYMKSLDIETKAKISRNALYNKINHRISHANDGEQLLTSSQGDDDNELQQLKRSLEHNRVAAVLAQLDKKNKKIETLDRENKRLMELNQSLLQELNELRSR